MTFLLQQVSAWFKSKGGFTHVLAVLVALCFVAFKTSTQFHDSALELYSYFPKWLDSLITLLIALYVVYRSSESTSAILDKARRLSIKGVSQKFPAIVMVCLLPFVTMPMTGCTISASQVKADGQAIAQACNSIAAQIAPVNPTLAARLTAASTALLAVTDNWTTGSAVADFNNAANAVEAILAAIPVTAPYATLVAIAVAAVDVLIANLNPNTVNVRLDGNPYIGKAHIKHRLGRSPEGDLKAAWNDEVISKKLTVPLLK